MSSIIGQQCPTFKHCSKRLTFSLYTLHRPHLYAVHFLLIIQHFKCNLPGQNFSRIQNSTGGDHSYCTANQSYLERTELLKDFYKKPFSTCNITLQPCLCAQNNFIMLHLTKIDLKNTDLDKTAAIKNKNKWWVKVLDVTYLFHLRLYFFVKEQKMNETKWHL